MFKAVKLPAGISDLNTSLTDVDGDALSHFRWFKQRKSNKKKLGFEERRRRRRRRRLSRRLLFQKPEFWVIELKECSLDGIYRRREIFGSILTFSVRQGCQLLMRWQSLIGCLLNHLLTMVDIWVFKIWSCRPEGLFGNGVCSIPPCFRFKFN